MTVYKTVGLVGTSGTSVSDAIRGAIQRADETLDHLGWFEVKEIRGRVDGGEVREFQVAIEVGFRVNAAKPRKERATAASQRNGTRSTRSALAQQASLRGERGRTDLARAFDRQPPAKRRPPGRR